MADKTVINTDQARQETERLRQLGSHFAESVAKLQSAADRYNGCWGGDKFGQAFAKGYEPNAKETLKNLGIFKTNISATADQVDQVIKDFETIDQNNAKNL